MVEVLPTAVPVAPVRSGQTVEAVVGRDDEISAISRFISALEHGGALLMVGEAGVGKTTLLAAATHIARARECRVLSVAGGQFDMDVSYASLRRLLEPVLDDIQYLPIQMREALAVALGIGEGPAPRPLVIYNAVLTLLTRVGETVPLLILIDDLPWLDRASATALASVSRRLSGTHVGLLASVRVGEYSVFERSGLEELEILPLAREDAEGLIHRSRPTLSPRLRQRVLDEARGNPLALVELAANASRGDSTFSDAEIEPAPLAGRLESSFARRLSELTDICRETLLLIGLSGREDLSGLVKTGLVVDRLAAGESAGLIIVDSATMTVRFGHPLMRSAVVNSATAEQRRRVHRFIALHIVDEPERRAWHLAEAADRPDESIAEELEEAARRVLARGDAAGAIGALTRAANLSTDHVQRARRLSEAAYLGADITGELAHASQLLADAQKLAPHLDESLHAAAAAAYMTVNGDGDVDAAYALLLHAVYSSDHGWNADNGELIEALSTLLLICWWAGREDYWSSFEETTRLLRPRIPELLWIQSNTFADTVRTGAAARPQLLHQIEQQGSEHEPNRLIRVNTSSVYMDLLAEVRPAAWRLVEDGRTGGAVRSGLGALMHLCLDFFAAGRWSEAKTLADEGLSVSREHGYGFIVWYFLFHQALLSAVTGDAVKAYAWADELADVTVQRHARGAEKFGYHARTLAAIGEGDWEAAFQYASKLSSPGALAPYTPHAMWVAYDLVEAAEHTKRRKDAVAHVKAMEGAGLSAISPRMDLLTRGARALIETGDVATRLFQHALDTPSAESWPFDLARIQLAFGEHLRRNSDIAAARALLHRALETFERLGAAPWAVRARAELRAARDVRDSFKGNRRVLVSLTEREQEIVELAAEGRTNKEIARELFVSPRTVSGYLYRVFPKLGITSRAALRDVMISIQADAATPSLMTEAASATSVDEGTVDVI